MRNIPILRAGFALTIINTLGWFAMSTFDAWPMNTTAVIVMNGAGYAAQAAMWIGCLELASRLHGRAAFGAKLAASGYAAGVAFSIAREATQAWMTSESIDTYRTVVAVLSYISLGVALVTTTGFVVAAWHRRRAAITGGAIAAGALAITTFAHVLASSDYWKLFEHISSGVWIVRVLALLWLAHRALPADATPSIPLAARGLRWMAKALWWRLAGSIAVALLSLMTLRSSTVEAFEVAFVVQIGLELAVLGAFGIGALVVARAALPESPRRVFVLGGLASMWCAGVMIVKAPYLYSIIRGSDDFRDGMRFVDGLSIGEPLVAVAAIALVALALRGIPGLVALADLVSSRAIAFVCLMLASIGLASFGVEHATSSGNAIGMMLFGAGASLVAMTLMAGMFGRAAEALESAQPNLPTATVV